MAQLLQGLGLDLPDAFARNAEDLTDLLECMVPRVADSEAHPQNALLARRQLRERLAHRACECARLRGGLRIDRIRGRNQVAKRGVAILAHWQVERGRLLPHREHLRYA